MFKRAMAISMAFIGVIVGAGFASGQEALQYFVAFGNWGLAGVALTALLVLITGVATLQLGSYFQANEHTAVFDEVSNPIISKILDWATIVTLFSIGFVMFAGGGSNIAQQFPAVPIWVGAVVMLVLVLLVGLLDVDRVTTVIGLITPFIILFVLGTTIYTIVTHDIDLSAMNDYASANVESPLPSWWISSLNYTGLTVMTAVSMSIVIGGNFLDNRAVGLGGALGGVVFYVMMTLLVVALYITAPQVMHADMPVLELINGINPALGYFMTFVIYGMVFNTAIGMFYALGKRLTRNNPKRFYPVYAASCIIGFGLSFVGFKDLVALVYPVLGYLGILMIVVLSAYWLKNLGPMRKETKRRLRARVLVQRRLDPRKRFTKKNERELSKLAAASNVDTGEFVAIVADEIHEELEADADLDYDREEPEPAVTYVQHTKPVAVDTAPSDAPSTASSNSVTPDDLDFGAAHGNKPATH
ncbi:YkvI family membrane protein [Corynebacterium phoceense]|uniref:YkvI family membrane protein n=1 Tax=Corynebacterium phoceense TaxID=1686286 RepID=UPI001D6E41C2|nr:hypothetical protein [Corynebacterium phoceense]HJG42974.1 hypothetical protein [Corynebacterium phoceense]